MAALRGCVASSSRSATASTHNLLRSSVASSARASSSSSTLQHTPSPSTSRRSARFSTSSPAWQARQASSAEAQSADTSSAAPSLSANGTNPALTPHDTTEEMQQWYRKQYPAALALPDDVLVQTVTHESYDHGMGKGGHNRRLAFLGRRAMQLYLSLFLHSQITQGAAAAAAASSSSSRPPASSSTASTLLSSELAFSKILHTSRLGDSVGRALKLEQIMRWRPAISDGQAGPKEIGLYKIRGTVVESLVGAIYHQHGAAAARAFFHDRVLPNVEAFDDAAKQALQEAIEGEARLGKDFIEKMEIVKPVEEAAEQVTRGGAAIEQVEASSESPEVAAQRSRAFDGAGAAAARGLSTRSSSSGAARRTGGGNVVFEEGSAEAAMATAGSRA